MKKGDDAVAMIAVLFVFAMIIIGGCVWFFGYKPMNDLCKDKGYEWNKDFDKIDGELYVQCCNKEKTKKVINNNKSGFETITIEGGECRIFSYNFPYGKEKQQAPTDEK